MTAGPAPKNGMKAAVVGSGPAGLTIAVLLARWGYDVTIFDARDKIGGVMRYGIPNYRLPDSVLDDFQYRHLELKGIKVRPNTTIGKTITIDDLFRDGYKSVFIGAGLWKANAMHIKGESLEMCIRDSRGLLQRRVRRGEDLLHPVRLHDDPDGFHHGGAAPEHRAHRAAEGRGPPQPDFVQAQQRGSVPCNHPGVCGRYRVWRCV